MTLLPDTIEAIETVEILNDIYMDSTKDEERLPFTFVYCNYWQGIKYFEETVWDDQDYNRTFIDQYDENEVPIGGEYEPIIECVKRRVRELHSVVRKFKI